MGYKKKLIHFLNQLFAFLIETLHNVRTHSRNHPYGRPINKEADASVRHASVILWVETPEQNKIIAYSDV